MLPLAAIVAAGLAVPRFFESDAPRETTPARAIAASAPQRGIAVATDDYRMALRPHALAPSYFTALPPDENDTSQFRRTVVAFAPQAPIENVAVAPLPTPRPTDLKPAELKPTDPKSTEPSRTVERRVAPQTRQIANATPTDNRSFFERLFEAATPSPALAYAPADTPLIAPRAPAMEAGTALYNISAGMVTLPSGEKLEAHSGLGAMRDDPRYVHLRMRGATPPGVYELREREALFHGVRAIRMNPVGGSGAIHGRGGILAHTYMLGPNGDSNGCISFRDYNRFLQAFLRGDVRRIVVISGTGEDALPPVAARAMGRAALAARARL